MSTTTHRINLSRVVGPALLSAAILLPPAAAQAQSANDFLGTILRGVPQGQDREPMERAVQACTRHAEDERLEVRRVEDARRVGNNDVEVVLRVEDRNDDYDVVCPYDTGDNEVRRLERNSSSQTRDQDEDIDERLAERARERCEDLARDRDLEDVDVVEVRARGRDRVEVALEGRDRGDRRDLTCLYDDDRREAHFAE